MNALVALSLVGGGAALASQKYAGRPTLNGHNPKDLPRSTYEVSQQTFGVPPLAGMLPARNIREYIFTDSFARGQFKPTGVATYNNGWTVTYDLSGPTGRQVFQQTDYAGRGQQEGIGGS